MNHYKVIKLDIRAGQTFGASILETSRFIRFSPSLLTFFTYSFFLNLLHCSQNSWNKLLYFTCFKYENEFYKTQTLKTVVSSNGILYPIRKKKIKFKYLILELCTVLEVWNFRSWRIFELKSRKNPNRAHIHYCCEFYFIY